MWWKNLDETSSNALTAETRGRKTKEESSQDRRVSQGMTYQSLDQGLCDRNVGRKDT